MSALQNEIDGNFDSFQRIVGSHLPREEGRWALMRHGDLIGFYDTADAAEAAGMVAYPDDLFSIQQATSETVDLGFFSYAFDNG
jgi:hypothetical protein